jgi:competence protein ComEC
MQGVNRMPSLVLSHGDIAHVGGARELAQVFALSRVYASNARFRSSEYRSLLEEFERSGRLSRVNAGDRLGPWEVLHPRQDKRESRADDMALVLRGTFYGTRVLMLPDLGPRGQSTLLEGGDPARLRSDIVLASPPDYDAPMLRTDLLEAIAPKLIVVCDSRGRWPGGQGQTKAEFRERLDGLKVPVFYCSRDGIVEVVIKRGEWRAKGETTGREVRGETR